MKTPSERRQFARLKIGEDAIALDSKGEELGKVAEAGGGGFLIFPATQSAVEKLKVGRRLRVTIHEPGSKAKNTLDVEVRYREGKALGVKFVSAKKS